MSVRALASELYKAVRLVEELEVQLRNTSLSVSDKAALQDRLRVARAERSRINALLQGAKGG